MDNQMQTNPSPQTTAHGYVEGLTEDLKLYGWVYAPSTPSARLEVEFLINGTVFAQSVADQFRQDVKDATTSDGFCGFFWPLPLKTLPGTTPLTITVRQRGSDIILPSPVCFPHPDSPFQDIAWATALREAGQNTQAREILQSLIARNPTFWHAHICLGDLAIAAQDLGSAQNWFAEAVRLAPDEIGPKLSLLEVLVAQGNEAEADTLLTQMLATYPDNSLLLHKQANRAQQAGDYPKMAALLAKALAQQPDNPVFMASLARAKYQLGQTQAANALLLQALALDPGQCDAITQLANQALTVGNAAQAYKIYQDAAAHNPDEPEFAFGMIDALAWQGYLEEALSGLTALTHKFGTTARIQNWRITLLRRTGQMEEALQIARSAALHEPAQFWLKSEQFQTELLAGSDARLIKSFLRIPARSKPEAALKLRYKGDLAAAFWQLEAAATAYEESAALNAEDPATQEGLARIKLMQLDLNGAREHLRRYYALTATQRRLRGQSLNISQSLLGQMIEEYALDAALATHLAHLRTMPLPQSLPALATCVKNAPDHIATAACLLLALREAEALTFTPALTSLPIPRQIIMFWHDTNRPKDVEALMQSWQIQNPSYTWRCFDEAGAASYLSATYPEPVVTAFQRAQEKPQKADLFRLAVLAAEGGVYADADDRCLHPLDSFLPAGANLVVAQEEFGCIGNHFIAACKGHPVLVRALNLLVEALNRGDHEMPWLLSGPGLLTRAVAHELASRAAVPAGLLLLDQRALGQHVAAACFATYKTYRMGRRVRRDAAAQLQAR